MDAQKACWLIAVVLFAIDAILAFRAWTHHMVLLAAGLVFFVLGFLVSGTLFAGS